MAQARNRYHHLEQSLGQTYLENRLSMRPAGVVSKKVMGDRKMAKAMRSCSFLLAWSACQPHDSFLARPGRPRIPAYLNRTKDPQDERLQYDEGG